MSVLECECKVYTYITKPKQNTHLKAVTLRKQTNPHNCVLHLISPAFPNIGHEMVIICCGGDWSCIS